MSAPLLLATVSDVAAPTSPETAVADHDLLPFLLTRWRLRLARLLAGSRSGIPA